MPATKNSRWLVPVITIGFLFGCAVAIWSAMEQPQPPSDDPNDDSIAHENELDSSTANISERLPESFKVDTNPTDTSPRPAGPVPAYWSNEQNIIWKTRLLGRGASTPLVIGDNVFVTAYTGYAIKPEDTEKKRLRLHLVCLDRGTGEQKWIRSIVGSSASQDSNEFFLVHGLASSSPVSDGINVYAFFGVSGVFAFDLDGALLWQADVGCNSDTFGSAASPLIHEDLLIVNASIESARLYAFDKSNGTVRWLFDRAIRSWSTPVIGKSRDGRTELVLSESFFVHGIDPLSGEELWVCDGVQDYVVPTPVIHEGIVYCSGGVESHLMAIEMGGSGDVSNSRKRWDTRVIGNVPSPTIIDQVICLIGDNGVLQQISMESGEIFQKHRVDNQQNVFSSLIGTSDYLFLAQRGIGITVLDRHDFTTVATNAPDPDAASPMSGCTISDQCLYYRSDDWIYCVGETSSQVVEHEVVKEPNQQIIKARLNYAFDPSRQTPKTFYRYMSGSREETIDLILQPYEIVLDSGPQRELLRNLVGEYWSQYRSIRDDEKEFLLQQNKLPYEEYYAQFYDIAKRMNELDELVRSKISPNFDEAQLNRLHQAHVAWEKSPEEKLRKGQNGNRDEKNE